MSGSLCIVGLGPGASGLVTPDVTEAIDRATDVVGYAPYVRRVTPRPGLTLHETDNREEIDRSRHALRLAGEGRHVVVVSSGDPGVFAMASAVFEALEAGPTEWKSLDIRVLPGVTAMLAAAAAAGAPLGHDFCCINLSDNLKPFELVERRICLALEADFAMAFYNPRSQARPHQFARVLELLREKAGPDRLIIFAKAVSTPDQRIDCLKAAEADPAMADMRTLVIVGSSATRRIDGTGFVYTPRSVP